MPSSNTKTRGYSQGLLQMYTSLISAAATSHRLMPWSFKPHFDFTVLSYTRCCETAKVRDCCFSGVYIYPFLKKCAISRNKSKNVDTIMII